MVMIHEIIQRDVQVQAELKKSLPQLPQQGVIVDFQDKKVRPKPMQDTLMPYFRANIPSALVARETAFTLKQIQNALSRARKNDPNLVPSVEDTKRAQQLSHIKQKQPKVPGESRRGNPGVAKSKEHRQKIGESRRKYFAEHPDSLKGKQTWWRGRKHTPETIEHMVRTRSRQRTQREKDVQQAARNAMVSDIFNRYGNLFFTIVYQIVGHVEDAHDIVGKIYLDALEKGLGKYTEIQDEGEKKTFLIAIARNKALGLVRHENVLKRKGIALVPFEPRDSGSSRMLAIRSVEDQVIGDIEYRELISQVPITALVDQKYSLGEIAVAFRKSESAIKSQSFREKEALRKRKGT